MAGDVTTLANLWLATLKNGTVKAFTDHDQDIVFSGYTYAAASGFTTSNVATSYTLNVDNLEVQGMLQSPSITEADLVAGLWDSATITLSIVNYKDLTQGAMSVRTGTIGNVSALRSHFVAELRGLTQPLQQNLLEYYTPACMAKLGDARCKVNLAPFTVTGSVTGAISLKAWNDTSLTQTTATIQHAIATVPPGAFPAFPALLGITNANPAVVHCAGHGFSSGNQVSFSGVSGMSQINGHVAVVTFIDANSFSINIDTTLLTLPYAPGYAVGTYGIYTGGGLATLMPTSEYFQNGLVTWITGLNAGLAAEVKLYSIGYLELFQPMPYTVAVGDTYTVNAGCDKQLTTCIGRFSNVVNFRGFPHIPGMDQMMQHG